MGMWSVLENVSYASRRAANSEATASSLQVGHPEWRPGQNLAITGGCGSVQFGKLETKLAHNIRDDF